MFDKEDFVVPLEKQLRLRITLDEIDHCDDIKVLQDNLKVCAQTLVSYQNLIAKITEKQLKQELENLIGKIDVQEELKNNG
tara:strand:+ start:473 stop:715 length:243 start_codon:yes stop_codon:yes gene_type:complete